jgi:hypothetical protein
MDGTRILSMKVEHLVFVRSRNYINMTDEDTKTIRSHSKMVSTPFVQHCCEFGLQRIRDAGYLVISIWGVNLGKYSVTPGLESKVDTHSYVKTPINIRDALYGVRTGKTATKPRSGIRSIMWM